ncbi:MAG: hypothetical protein ABIH03_16180 [Pseudomonadota bacterium]
MVQSDGASGNLAGEDGGDQRNGRAGYTDVEDRDDLKETVMARPKSDTEREIEQLEMMLNDPTFTRSLSVQQYRAMRAKLRMLRPVRPGFSEKSALRDIEPAPLDVKSIVPAPLGPMQVTGMPRKLPAPPPFPPFEPDQFAAGEQRGRRAAGIDAFSKYLSRTAPQAQAAEASMRNRKRITSKVSRAGRASFAFSPGEPVNPAGSRTNAGMGLGPVVSSGPQIKARRQAEQESLLQGERERLGVTETPEEQEERDFQQRERRFQQEQAWKQEERRLRHEEFTNNIESAMELADTVELPPGSPAWAVQNDMKQAYDELQQLQQYAGHGADPVRLKPKVAALRDRIAKGAQRLSKIQEQMQQQETAEQQAVDTEKQKQAETKTKDAEQKAETGRLKGIQDTVANQRVRATALYDLAVKSENSLLDRQVELTKQIAEITSLVEAEPERKKDESEEAYTARKEQAEKGNAPYADLLPPLKDELDEVKKQFADAKGELKTSLEGLTAAYKQEAVVTKAIAAQTPPLVMVGAAIK